jgi:hypothetical protein
MDSVALVRSMTNREGEHQRATYFMKTGYLPLGGIRFPSIGSVVASEIGPREFDLPHFVQVGGRGLGGAINSGYLPIQYSPFFVGDPNNMPANTTLPGGTDQARLTRRIGLMQDLERDFAESGGQARVTDHRAHVNGAANMVRSPRLQAFDLSRETAATRDRYGRNPFGQGCLLARRLVESGVTFVEVGLGGWDTHNENFTATTRLSGQADAGFANLVRDLRERNRLDRTLIIWTGEFGRTPRVGQRSSDAGAGSDGRDHWAGCFTSVLAGGGARGGYVHGKSDRYAAYPAEDPVHPADLIATAYHLLGVPESQVLSDAGGRPRFVRPGKAIEALLG